MRTMNPTFTKCLGNSMSVFSLTPFKVTPFVKRRREKEIMGRQNSTRKKLYCVEHWPGSRGRFSWKPSFMKWLMRLSMSAAFVVWKTRATSQFSCRRQDELVDCLGAISRAKMMSTGRWLKRPGVHFSVTGAEKSSKRSIRLPGLINGIAGGNVMMRPVEVIFSSEGNVPSTLTRSRGPTQRLWKCSTQQYFWDVSISGCPKSIFLDFSWKIKNAHWIANFVNVMFDIRTECGVTYRWIFRLELGEKLCLLFPSSK